MPQLTYFLQTCPTCGRASQVRIEYLGTTVSCRHCGGTFSASGDESPRHHQEVRELAGDEASSQHGILAAKKPR